MLSRRDKLYVQPWQDRRFRDHRNKVETALPAIDTSAPAARPHVALKLKKLQREADRKTKVQSDNFSLLQRLHAIMRVNRLDNHWTKPLPVFQNKVGQYYDVGAWSRRSSDRSELDFNDVKCYACARKATAAAAACPRRSQRYG
ncbi:sperm axonemal maintenance protein CFAP97D1 [Battus philenor]|uniref:sperm axonemal maintenance protein CFAP97D1 n=1 Tax=Battus philenor TaxID=42288 RepID=UPI0035D0A511